MKHDIRKCLEENIMEAIEAYLRHMQSTAFITHDDKGRVLVFGDEKFVRQHVAEMK